MTVQLDLFGAVEQAEHEAAQRQEDRAAWRARFERAEWVAPYDLADGRPAGTCVPAWKCPDPDCGEIEPGPTGFLLSINHGFDPDVPGRAPWHGRCLKVWRRRSDTGTSLERGTNE